MWSETEKPFELALRGCGRIYNLEAKALDQYINATYNPPPLKHGLDLADAEKITGIFFAGGLPKANAGI